MGNPRVTVAVPAWNGAAFIEQAIASILAQTFEDFELVVIDDCSDDDTMAIVSRFADRRIRTETNSSRLGLVGNWNRCLDSASGEYVNIFHQDDVMAPDNLRRKVALLDQNPSAAFVHSDVRQIGSDGAVLSERWYAPLGADEGGLHAGRVFLDRLFAGENMVCCPSVLMRRTMVERHGHFDPLLPFTADWEMWMRLCLFHDAGYVPDSLIDYRRHARAETERYRGAHRLRECFRAKDRLLEKYGAHLPLVAWRTALTGQFATEISERLAEALTEGRTSDARELVTLARTVLTRAPGDDGSGNEDGWIVDLLRETSEHATWSHRCRADAAVDHAADVSQQLQAWTSRALDAEARAQELESFRTRCEELDGAVTAASERARSAENQVRAAEARLQALDATVHALRRSHSWRLTAPLRLLFRLLTGRRH